MLLLALSDLPEPVRGIAAFFAFLTPTVILPVLAAKLNADRVRRKAASSIPPPPAEPVVDTLVRAVMSQARWREEELQRELSEALKELREAREDVAQARKAYADERERRRGAERELARVKNERFRS